jgi:hypothetical protein
MTIYTNSSSCSGSAVTGSGGGKRKIVSPGSNRSKAPSPVNTAQAGVALAGLLFIGLFGCRSRRVWTRLLAAGFVVAVLGFAASGCGGSSPSSSSSSSSSDAAKGTYTLSITGTDTSSSITASTTMTLTID